MKHGHLKILAATLLSLSIVLPGCTTSHPSADDGASTLNAGADRSYTDAELEGHDGSGYFPDAFTFDELLEDHSCQPGTSVDGAFTAGAYLIGSEGAPPAGTYRLDGSEEETGELAVYSPADDDGLYRPKFTISYLGPTLVQLDAEDAVFFEPPLDACLMRQASADPLVVAPPYESGMYRVGLDIPAGTYTVTQSELSEAAIAAKGYARPQVIVYSSLAFDTDNEVSEEELPRLENGPVSVTVTVEDGQYLELYGTMAVPEEA